MISISSNDGEVMQTEVQSAAVAEQQVERILQSETFRTSDALRRLLKFLLVKSLAGEADQLKEYSVAVDGLGRPESFDPRHESIVRIHMGRLRQKLEEFYRTEGKDDLLIVHLPKGRFKLVYESRPSAAEIGAPANPVPVRSGWLDSRWRLAVAALALLWCFTCVAWWYDHHTTPDRRQGNAELNQLWGPLINSSHPLIVSIADQLFASFDGFGLYGRRGLYQWEDFLKSEEVTAVRKALHNVEMHPYYYYAPVGDVDASFLLGKLLGPRVPALSLVKTSELSWQQLAENNIVYIGAGTFLGDRLAAGPVDLDFQPLISELRTLRNLHPQPGEPLQFADRTGTGVKEDGEIYALITHVAGPRGTNDILSFTSNRASGRLAAVRWFTEADSAGWVQQKLRKPSGETPRYYQVLLQVVYKDGVPLESTYVLHHELHLKSMSLVASPR